MGTFPLAGAYCRKAVIGNFLRFSVKACYEKEQNLRGPPILNEEARGYFIVPTAKVNPLDLPSLTNMEPRRPTCKSTVVYVVLLCFQAPSNPLNEPLL